MVSRKQLSRLVMRSSAAGLLVDPKHKNCTKGN
jgi:hypothetical protein